MATYHSVAETDGNGGVRVVSHCARVETALWPQTWVFLTRIVLPHMCHLQQTTDNRTAVSYTHLDVYKRQAQDISVLRRRFILVTNVSRNLDRRPSTLLHRLNI